MWTTEGLRYCKQRLRGDFGGHSEEQNTDTNVSNKYCAHEVLDGNESSTGYSTRSHLLHCGKGFIYILFMFRNFTEAEFKGDGIIN
jgi:hypothetical protein